MNIDMIQTISNASTVLSDIVYFGLLWLRAARPGPPARLFGPYFSDFDAHASFLIDPSAYLLFALSISVRTSRIVAAERSMADVTSWPYKLHCDPKSIDAVAFASRFEGLFSLNPLEDDRERQGEDISGLDQFPFVYFDDC